MRYFVLIPCVLTLSMLSAFAQDTEKIWSDSLYSGISFRSIGPAFMSGRIADIAIHPEDDNCWYVAVGSGGVWKTNNAGVTWTPLFDGQSSYSTGCVTIDPNEPQTIWVGTGENVGGRHVGYGDGVYRSQDGGATWKNMGLKASEHISKIIVHPDNSDVIWVAAQGPLWSKGGERGLYKSTDGGESWKKVLGDEEWTGVTDIVMDPRDPDRLYAATWQRHRTIAAYMGGGPETRIYYSSDGGENWTACKKGLPSGKMGKIGLAISPQNPDVLYAAIELERRTGAVYRSADRGHTWTKGAEAISGGTGPHYYQELYACPHQFDRIYLMDVRMQVSDDGGKSFRRVKEQYKHSDNHAMAFRADDPDYLLVGSDGGLYESFDLAENWRFIKNLPLTQFYKLALDDATPFYNIYGGTQDNNTQYGPSRTDNQQGIQNSDWRVVLGGDGHQPATEPGNPDIVYAEWQQGNLNRIDMTTGEIVAIQPQPAAGEDYERFNWDAPILVSPHDPARLFFASQRVWRSDNRGDSWTAISDDLTRDLERIELPIMGQTQSWDSPWDIYAMSNFSTITSLAESPLQENLIYAGTDDGLIQVTEDGGENWRRIEVGDLPGVPENAFVNDIKADLHDANTVYVALDNHKYGDFAPYLLKSTDRGRSWTSLAGDLPERHLVWRLVQDHVDPQLLFVATEFGVFFSKTGGSDWIKIKGGVPTISFRDLAIHQREEDLVAASFGRSFYVLDDYSFLRELAPEVLQQEAWLFPLRDAWWYVPRPALSTGKGKGSQGAAHFIAPNPPFGAVFTVYVKESYLSKKVLRQKAEKEDPESVAFPGWEAVEAERRSIPVKLWLVVRNASGEEVRKVEAPAKAGFHRVAWDLRHPPTGTVREGQEDKEGSGLLAAPGTYTVALYKEQEGTWSQLGETRQFEVKPLREGALPGSSPEEVAAFNRQYEQASTRYSALRTELGNRMRQLESLEAARQVLADVEAFPQQRYLTVRENLYELEEAVNGNRSKAEVGEKNAPTIGSRLYSVSRSIRNATYGPTPLNREQLQLAKQELAEQTQRLKTITVEMRALANIITEAGGPYIEGLSDL